MYTVTVTRDVIAQHYLTVPDCGPENDLHSHRYAVEIECRGKSLDNHGYLVDIDDVSSALDAIESYYEDSTLNELPEFQGLNPSVEHFARIVSDDVVKRLPTDNLSSLVVRIWEDDDARAAYRVEFAD